MACYSHFVADLDVFYKDVIRNSSDDEFAKEAQSRKDDRLAHELPVQHEAGEQPEGKL